MIHGYPDNDFPRERNNLLFHPRLRRALTNRGGEKVLVGQPNEVNRSTTITIEEEERESKESIDRPFPNESGVTISRVLLRSSSTRTYHIYTLDPTAHSFPRFLRDNHITHDSAANATPPLSAVLAACESAATFQPFPPDRATVRARQLHRRERGRRNVGPRGLVRMIVRRLDRDP